MVPYVAVQSMMQGGRAGKGGSGRARSPSDMLFPTGMHRKASHRFTGRATQTTEAQRGQEVTWLYYSKGKYCSNRALLLLSRCSTPSALFRDFHFRTPCFVLHIFPYSSLVAYSLVIHKHYAQLSHRHTQNAPHSDHVVFRHPRPPPHHARYVSTITRGASAR